MSFLALFLFACNTAPVDYRDRGPCIGPDDTRCQEKADRGEEAVMAGDYLLCSMEHGIVPIDDPVLERCDEVTAGSAAVVWHVFDGNEAKAYVIGALLGREIVHDTLSGDLVAVDY